MSDADREAAIRRRVNLDAGMGNSEVRWLLEQLAAERTRADDAERSNATLAKAWYAARAERDALAAQVEQLRTELERVLDALDALGLTPMPEAAAFGVAIALNIARSALVATDGTESLTRAESGKP